MHVKVVYDGHFWFSFRCYRIMHLHIFVLQIYESVLFFHGIPEGEFDARWKSFHAVKKALEDKVCVSMMNIWQVCYIYEIWSTDQEICFILITFCHSLVSNVAKTADSDNVYFQLVTTLKRSRSSEEFTINSIWHLTYKNGKSYQN